MTEMQRMLWDLRRGTYSGGKGTQERLPREGNVQMRSTNVLGRII